MGSARTASCVLIGSTLALLAACGGSHGGSTEGTPPGPGDDLPPSITIAAPNDQATVTRVIRLVANAVDDRGIVHVTFRLDGGLVGTADSEAPYEVVFDPARYPNGAHELTATVVDTAGQSASADIAIAVENPLGAKVLLTWAEIEARLVGTFNIPAAQEGDYRFGYSNGVHAQLANGNLLVMGHPWYPVQAEVQLPAQLDGSEATRVGPWYDVTNGALPTGWSGGPAYELGGMLEIAGRLYFTKNQWYNGAGSDWETQGYREADTVRGMWKVAGTYTHHSRVGGYMSEAPLVVRAEGYTYLAGLEGTSGAALGRWGPNLFAIQSDGSVPDGGSLPSRALICHDTEAHAPPGWWIGDKVSGMVWIETTTHHAVLCLLHQKLGNTWYGEASDGGDPYGGGKGYHAEGYALKAWIYDPADLLAVYRGERDPWAVAPIEEQVLTERQPGSSTEVQHSFFTGSAIDELQVSRTAGRMIILQPGGYRPGQFEGMPKGYVLDMD